MSNVVEQIEQQIAKLSSKAVKKNTGTILAIADGVAKLDGLSEVMYNEMVQFPGGAIGIALNLEEDEVGCVILGDIANLKQGDEVQTTGKLLSVPVGRGLLGRVVDALGRPVDGKGPLAATEFYPVEKIAPGIIVRKSVSQPVFTGIMAIDSMIPIGRGQRELIIGDRGTGKTTICIDTIINQARINKVGLASGDKNFRPMYSIYVAIGQKQSNIVRTIGAGSRIKTCVQTAIGHQPQLGIDAPEQSQRDIHHDHQDVDVQVRASQIVPCQVAICAHHLGDVFGHTGIEESPISQSGQGVGQAQVL